MNDAPIVISFYSDDAYYQAAASRLRGDCTRLGYDHDLVEIAKAPHESWADICRRKIGFYLEMHRKHRRPIWWLDVDSRLSQRLAALESSRCDMAAFLRGLRYLRGFEAAVMPRFFSPFSLYFNQTPAATKFLELMAEIEQAHKGPATDDYFLQEAWARHEQEMSVLVLPPSVIGRQWPLEPQQSIYVGISGNVSLFKNQVEQHVAPAATPAGRKTALMSEAAVALAAGELQIAELLYSRALALAGRDDELANKIARVMRRDGRVKAAIEHLQRYQGAATPLDLASRFGIESDLQSGQLGKARASCAKLLQSKLAEDRRWAEIASIRISLEERAKAAKVANGDRPALAWDDAQYTGYVGDLLPLYIVERLAGRPPWLTAPTKGALVGGSSIRKAAAGQSVWGSGISSNQDMLHPQADYRAVRGPMTRQRVLDSGGTCPDVLGGPTWFLRALRDPAHAGRGAALGLALHPTDEGLLTAGAGVRTLSTRCTDEAGVEAFLSALQACAAVLTTSLTTLIACHACGVPARWLHVEDREKPGAVNDEEILDHLMSIGVDAQAKGLSINQGSMVERAHFDVDATWLPVRPIDLRSLAAGAPFNITHEQFR